MTKSEIKQILKKEYKIKKEKGLLDAYIDAFYYNSEEFLIVCLAICEDLSKLPIMCKNYDNGSINITTDKNIYVKSGYEKVEYIFSNQKYNITFPENLFEVN